MADARKLPSGRFQARWMDGKGTRRVVPGGTHKSEKLAREAAILYENQMRKESAVAAAPTDVTWGEWCEAWWPTRAVKPSQLKKTTSTRDMHLMPRWKDVPLRDIRRHDVRAWVVQLARTPARRSVKGVLSAPTGKTLAASTVQRIVHLFSASLRDALDAELIATNPAVRLRLPPSSEGAERYLTRHEVELLASEFDDHTALALWFLVLTGLRFGEMAGLHWHRVDLDNNLLHVLETWDEVDGKVWPYPKGRRSRVVPLHPDLVARLRELPRGADTCGYPHEEGRCRSGLVLKSLEGTIWRVSKFDDYLKKGVEITELGHVRVHDLRHTYASWLLQSGKVSLERVADLLGHVSTQTTRRYRHFVKDQFEDVLAALGGAAAVNSTPRPPRLRSVAES